MVNLNILTGILYFPSTSTMLSYCGGQVCPAVPIFSWIHDSWAVTLESVEVSIFPCYPASHLAYTPGWSASAHPTPQLTTPAKWRIEGIT